MAQESGFGELESLSGFGQSEFVQVSRVFPTTVDQVFDLFKNAKSAGRKVVLRGAGRSYGDAAIAKEAITLDCSNLNRVLGWDKESGLIDCEGGVTVEQLWRTGLPDGWWPPVVSGTMYPTLAGALAMNIHGKNAFAVGTLGEHASWSLLDVALAYRQITDSHSWKPMRSSGP